MDKERWPTRPNQREIDAGEPTVEYGGKLWPVPMLSIKELRLVQTKIDRLAEIIIEKETPQRDYTPEVLEDLSYVLYVALTRAHPELPRAEFDDMKTSRRELVLAFLLVLVQANGVRPAPPKPADGQGEAQGSASPSIGTE